MIVAIEFTLSNLCKGNKFCSRSHGDLMLTEGNAENLVDKILNYFYKIPHKISQSE